MLTNSCSTKCYYFLPNISKCTYEIFQLNRTMFSYNCLADRVLSFQLLLIWCISRCDQRNRNSFKYKLHVFAYAMWCAIWSLQFWLLLPKKCHDNVTISHWNVLTIEINQKWSIFQLFFLSIAYQMMFASKSWPRLWMCIERIYRWPWIKILFHTRFYVFALKFVAFLAFFCLLTEKNH